MEKTKKVLRVIITVFIIVATAFISPEIIPFIVIIAFLSLIYNIFKKVRERSKTSDFINEHNEREVASVQENKNKRGLIIVLAVIFFITFPFSLPFLFIGVIIFILNRGKKLQAAKKRHGDERYDHHEDECINCGSSFHGDVNEDCIFCGDGDNYDTDDYSSDIYNGSYDKDTNMKDDFDLKDTLNGLGRSVSDFAKSTKDSYDSSSWKPRIENATGWLKEELTMREKDTDEDAVTYSGTYDDKKEEAEGLKVLLKAGIIEKDEYNDRLRELKNRR